MKVANNKLELERKEKQKQTLINSLINIESKRESRMKDYQESVIELYKVASRGTGSSEVAAQVLLSCYNGYDYKVSIPELCTLDDCNFKHAINCITGRTQLMKEPQELIKNGSELFEKLAKKWEHLKT